MLFQQITMLDYARPLAERARDRKLTGPYQWKPSQPGRGRGFYQASKGYLHCSPRGSTFDLRLDFARDHIPSSQSYRLPLGYYCDRHGDETITPIVARLPHSRGFMAGWTMGAGMCAALKGDIFDSIEEAAHAAFGMAEYDAEEMREADTEETEEGED